MINVILMNNKRIDDDLHRVIFRVFYRMKICWLETLTYKKIEHYNLIGMVILLQNLLSNVNV